MMKRWIFLVVVLTLLLAAAVTSERRRVSARVSPAPILYFLADTQRELTRLPVSFAPLPDSEEIQIGDSLARQYARMTAHQRTKEAKLVEDYVQRVGAAVASHAHRSLPYKFHYSPGLYDMNAFALPGGHVFIGEGFMSLMDTEDELAAVLGHEVEHVDHRHCAERLQIEQALRKQPLGALIGIPVEVFEVGYSKDQEFEADREGTLLAVQAGYSPLGAVHMFEAYQKIEREQSHPAASPQEELSRVALETIEGYFRSHPSTSDRLAELRRLIASQNWGDLTHERPLSVAYIFLTERAAQELERKKYSEAAKLAARSLELQPAQPSALSILAQAKVALGDFAAVRAAYQQLVQNSPGEADAIRNFADELTESAMERRDYKKAIELASLSLELQPNRAGALMKLGEAQLALGDYAAATEVTRKLKSMYPAGASQVLEYADSLTDWAFKQGRFDQAARLASFGLDFVPNQEPVMKKLAESQFAAANFAAAAVAYRKLLDHQVAAKEQLNLALIRSYADALGTIGAPGQAVRDFEGFLASAKITAPSQQAQVRVELAGLKVLAGDPAGAQAEARNRSVPPEFMARLGWWCYRAGDYVTAISVLRIAVHARPGDEALENSLAWAELEQDQVLDAEIRFNLAIRDTNAAEPPLWNTPQMGRAIARWQLRQTDGALDDFEAVVKNVPQWRNPNWVKALYSGRVTESVAQMEAERQRRLETQRRAIQSVSQPRR